MKKTFLIFLLCPFLYLTIGYFPFILIKQQIIKHEIKQIIRNNPTRAELSEFIFDKTTFSSLIWIEENEFSFNDHMYDVVKIDSLKDNKIHVFCIDDKNENSLIKKLYQLRKEGEKTQQNGKEFFLKFFVKDFLKTNTITFKNSYKNILRIDFYNDQYVSFIPEKPGPPPKYC